MFEFVRKHTRLLQFVLVLLIFPSFVFFGIQGYDRFSDERQATAARVAGRDITLAELDAAHRNQVERMRRQMPPGVDASLFDNPEMKRQTLEALVRDRVMNAAVDKQHLVTTDDRLKRLFVSDPQFAFLRNPDGSVNKDLLAAQGMSSEQFAARLRHDLSTHQVLHGVEASVLAPTSVTAAAFDALFQQREVQVQKFDPKDFASKVNPTDAEIEAYYKDPANAAKFQSPEQASIEYVVLDLESIIKGIKVPEEELRKYYAENVARFSTLEERRASHILIKADKSAPAADRAKAKAKAESLLPEAKKSPTAFAELARKHSEDPGSAAKGGDLDYFGRGAMVKPFEDVAFSLKSGQTSDIVESDFGYHIITVTGVRGGGTKTFEEVRAEIETEAKKQQAQKRYAEAAEQFTNTVYEQSDSLKPAVDKLKLQLRTATVQRKPTPDASGALANVKFLDALFGADALRNKRNTDAIEVGPNQMISGRVVQYTPARQRPLVEVKAQVREALANATSAELARKAGEARLAAGKQDAASTLGGETLVVSRAQARELPREVLDAILKADASKLPAWIGVDQGAQGYTVVRLTKVLARDPIAADPVRAQAQYAKVWAGAESQAYYNALKKRFKVEVMEQPKVEEGAAQAPSQAASR
jgi:peptidyl-prolyl cis-trans isomerase D